MQRACEASLRRLQTDRIDLYQTHFDDEVTPPEETMAGFDRLIKEGKVRAAGELRCRWANQPAPCRAFMRTSGPAGPPARARASQRLPSPKWPAIHQKRPSAPARP